MKYFNNYVFINILINNNKLECNIIALFKYFNFNYSFTNIVEINAKNIPIIK